MGHMKLRPTCDARAPACSLSNAHSLSVKTPRESTAEKPHSVASKYQPKDTEAYDTIENTPDDCGFDCEEDTELFCEELDIPTYASGVNEKTLHHLRGSRRSTAACEAQAVQLPVVREVARQSARSRERTRHATVDRCATVGGTGGADGAPPGRGGV